MMIFVLLSYSTVGITTAGVEVEAEGKGACWLIGFGAKLIFNNEDFYYRLYAQRAIEYFCSSIRLLQIKNTQYRNSKEFPIIENIQMQGKRKQIQDYLAKNVNTFVQPMIYEIVKKRPADPAAYAAKWLQDFITKRSTKSLESGSDCSEEEEEQMQTRIQKSKAKGKKRSRVGISEEVFGNFNKKDQVEFRCIPKSEQAKMLILSLVRNSILFSNLDQKQQTTVINAMEEKKFEKGDHVITQGDKGDCLYIVSDGEFDCFKRIDGSDKYLKTYKRGQAFGELSLMHNAPRAATIIAKDCGHVFALDRITFSQIVKQSAIKKRELYQSVISSVSIFSQLSAHEKQQFYDVLKEQKYDAGEYVIKQGDFGSQFYIVIEGNLVAEKKEEGDQFPKVVYQYKAGDYFGELSLIHDISRQASIKALTKVRLASIERESFKRLLGSLEDILKRNQERYHLIQKQITV